MVIWQEAYRARRPFRALAAPLIVRDEVAAVVYLESVDGEHRFDEGHLQLLTAVAGMAAVAWENATILGWLQEENERLQSELKIEHGMVGVSDKLRDLQRQIAKVAPSNSNVLILGESGTGKELIARALHRNSLRAAGPFVAINCAALTETLLESELFGHERGAFTGAITQKKGKLEVAEGGTVFLDEIGELSPLLQAKLLRVLQEREMERVGGTKTIPLNIRLLAATNRDLEQAVQKGDFRRDLFYRLNVVSLKAPALRDRPEDTLPLAEHFAKKYAAECGRKIIGLAPEARAYLQELLLARQCSRTGERHRARRGAGLGRHGSGRRSARAHPRIAPGRRLGQHVRRSRGSRQAAGCAAGLRSGESRSRSRRQDPGPASQLPAQADPDHGFEAGVEEVAQVRREPNSTTGFP